MGGSWYNQGSDGIEKEQHRLDDLTGPGRLWIPGGESKEGVFVDDEMFCIYEHNPKIDGGYRNWFTCGQGVHDEVVCCQKLGPKSRYYVGFLTWVDCSKWTDQRGNTHQYEMRLMPLKMKSMKKFKRKKDDKGSLISTYWRLTREEDQSPQVGDDWEFKRDVDMDKMFPHVCYRGKKLSELWDDAEGKPEAMEHIKRTFQIEPKDGKLPLTVPAFNYFRLLEPKPPKDIRILLGAVQPEDEDKSPSRTQSYKSGGDIKEEDVPF